MSINKMLVCVCTLFITVFSSCSPKHSHPLTLLPSDGSSVRSRVLDTFQKQEFTSPGACKKSLTRAIQVAIRFIINNRSKVESIVRSLSGSRAAEVFVKYFSQISNALRSLLTYSSLVPQTVYDTVYRVIREVTNDSHIATKVALAIKEALSWFK